MPLYPLSRKLRIVFFYNLLSTTLWFCCLGRFAILLPLVGRRFLPQGIADFFHVCAVLPLAGFFIVNLLSRSSYSIKDLWALFSSLRMVWICYGVIFPHPAIAKHTSYSFLIAAWCMQNVIDYSYHSFKLKTKSSPHFLFFLHYSHFYFTFPISFVSELLLVMLSLAFVNNPVLEKGVKATLLSYIPIGYFTFRYLRGRRERKYVQYLEKRAAGRLSGAVTQQVSTASPATS